MGGSANNWAILEDYVTIEESTDASCNGEVLRNRYCGARFVWSDAAMEIDAEICGE